MIYVSLSIITLYFDVVYSRPKTVTTFKNILKVFHETLDARKYILQC